MQKEWKAGFQTKLRKADGEGITMAVSLLQAGELVGIPTETVYGLAADALNPSAAAKIYAAKGRPSDNPLIVHIAGLEMLEPLTRARPRLAYTLAEAFWPGPLTMIFPKADRVPDATTGGMDTVAVRMPSHPVAERVIRESGLALAAPSANLSGLPSPTRAEHVFQDMNGRIPLILDGGECAVGVESTVIAVGEDFVRLLRPGGITVEMLSRYCRVEVDGGVLHRLADGEKALSPGMKYKHYAPKANVIILDGGAEDFVEYVRAHQGPGVWAMAFEGEEGALEVPSLPFGRRGDGLSQARVLFDRLRECDEKGARTVYVPMPEKDGVGLAVYNRLLRAAGFTVVAL
ncbi:MAG: L-threonylcarbamoyladenylate synthase [Candidatus Merdivicinus sp.]|jgi:L-threonylcarbamoyladenylate synthase